MSTMVEKPIDEEAQAFTLWALSVIDMTVEKDGERFFAMLPKPHQRSEFNGAHRVQFTFDPAAGRGGAFERVTAQSPLFRWISRKIGDIGKAIHVCPSAQPVSVAEVAPALFDAYTIDRGKAQLAGCRLEERPLLRLTFRYSTENNGVFDSVKHRFVDREGNELAPEFIDPMQLLDLAPPNRKSAPLADADLDQWIAKSHDNSAGEEVICATVIWCKYAEGKIAFHVRGQIAELPFSNWARLLTDVPDAAPAFVCPHSGKRSHNITSTDDGRITVAEAVGVCEETGRQVLATELARCEATGALVLEKTLHECPVSRRLVKDSSLEDCKSCKQKVSPMSNAGGVCEACRRPEKVAPTDQRILALQEKHDEFKRFRHWSISETATSRIFQTSTLTKRWLIVENRESNELNHFRHGSKWNSKWRDLPLPK